MKLLVMSMGLAVLAGTSAAAVTNAPPWPTVPLTLGDALDTALAQNPAIRKGQQDIEEAYGVSMQLRSTALPKLTGTGNYGVLDRGKIEKLTVGGGNSFSFRTDQSWSADLTISQTLIDGGKMRSSLRSAKLTKEAALRNFESLVSDTLLNVRIAVADVLLDAELIVTQEASVHLLEKELTDTQRRYDAGTVPQFNVLRASVELANAKPRLIKARNDYRIAKNNLATLLGYDIPSGMGEDIPLEISGKLAPSTNDVELSTSIAKAYQQRPELAAARTNERLRHEDIVQARSDYFPKLSGQAGYGWVNRVYGPNGGNPGLDDEVHGWSVGLVANWSIWDFGLTQGKVKAARATQEKARIDVDDLYRKVEQEVRTAHSTLIQARETLESQGKVIEQGQEALRLAVARSEAGTGTQLDVLSAQTALTDARTTYVQAEHDLVVAQQRLARAMGEGIMVRSVTSGPSK
jgi:TolC family type I secretion outer membrane protein